MWLGGLLAERFPNRPAVRGFEPGGPARKKGGRPRRSGGRFPGRTRRVPWCGGPWLRRGTWRARHPARYPPGADLLAVELHGVVPAAGVGLPVDVAGIVARHVGAMVLKIDGTAGARGRTRCRWCGAGRAASGRVSRSATARMRTADFGVISGRKKVPALTSRDFLLNQAGANSEIRASCRTPRCDRGHS